MKLYLYEENICGIDPYHVFAETKRLPREFEQPDENGDFYRYLGCAESESDVDSILYENGYDGEYAMYFMRDLAYQFGRVW